MRTSLLSILFLLFSAGFSFCASALSMLDRVDPQLRPALEAAVPIDLAGNGLHKIRELFDSVKAPALLPTDPTVKVYDIYIDNANLSDKMRLRIYEYIDREAEIPAILWIHGGGTAFGCPELDEAQNIRFAKDVGALVVSVDYRLSPENSFPIPLEDCYTALVWLADNCAELGVDKERIAVAGSSAGGGLCAALTLLARDRGGPKIAFQMPLYPMIDDRIITPSRHEIFDPRVWNTADNILVWEWYLGDVGPEDVTPYMAPARAVDLSGLPPAYSCVGELDPFRDDTIDYMARLSRAGVETEFHLYPGAYHAFEVLAKDTDYSRRVFGEFVFVLKRALAK